MDNNVHFIMAERLVVDTKPLAVASEAHTTSKATAIAIVANFMRTHFKDLVDAWETAAKAGPGTEERAYRAGVIAKSCNAIAQYYSREMSMLPQVTNPVRTLTDIKSSFDKVDLAVTQAETEALKV